MKWMDKLTCQEIILVGNSTWLQCTTYD